MESPMPEIIKEKKETISDYFAKPRRERERWGFWYVEPRYRFFSLDDLRQDTFQKWKVEIAKRYPIQFKIRELFEILQGYCWQLKYKTEYYYRYIFKPQHRDIASAVPRIWEDINSVIVKVNFQIIKSFYKEAKESCVDWEYYPEQKKCMEWLEYAYQYIMIERAKMEKVIQDKYDDVGDNFNFKEIHELEEILNKTDKRILVEMITWKDYLWT